MTKTNTAIVSAPASRTPTFIKLARRAKGATSLQLATAADCLSRPPTAYYMRQLADRHGYEMEILEGRNGEARFHFLAA